MHLFRFHGLFVVAALSGWLSAFAQSTPESGASVIELDNPTGPEKNVVRQLSPVDFFRNLLAMSPQQREPLLASRTPGQRKVLLAKLQEYESLPPEACELRLRHTQLRWYLLGLMNTPLSERQKRLAEVPAQDRSLFEERLRQWDAMPIETQKLFLENESAVASYLERQTGAGGVKAIMPPERVRKLDEELKRWEALSSEQRQNMCDLFGQFFEYNEKEKQKTLGALSEAERRQMQQALEGYASLPPEQRKQRIESLRKFVSLTPEARQQFLQNAVRWQAMSKAERDLWRQMVKQLPPLPPVPPGLIIKSPPMPPVPPLGR